jgi:hypothetical protein
LVYLTENALTIFRRRNIKNKIQSRSNLSKEKNAQNAVCSESHSSFRIYHLLPFPIEESNIVQWISPDANTAGTGFEKGRKKYYIRE